jgi:hypothetical protein
MDPPSHFTQNDFTDHEFTHSLRNLLQPHDPGDDRGFFADRSIRPTLA